MNDEINRILNHKWKRTEVTFENFKKLKETIPAKPGLYIISTDCPANILGKTGNRIDKMHYNLEKKIKDSNDIPGNIIIKQIDNGLFCIYNGHQKNLRQRFNEHFIGTKGTGCMAIFQIEDLKEYRWEFKYLNLEEIEGYKDSPLFRSILEQHLRVRDGWPILCTQ